MNVTSATQRRDATVAVRPWASRSVATLGIVVMTIGFFTPIASRDAPVPGGGATPLDSITLTFGDAMNLMATFHLGLRSLPLRLGVAALTSAILLGGLALIPFLWRTLSPRWTVALRSILAGWVALTTALAAIGVSNWWRIVFPPMSVGPGTETATFGAPHLLPGAVVFPLGALVSGAALLLMLREPAPVAASVGPRTGWLRASSGALTAGLFVWLLGFYLMPEAITAACPPVTFSVTQFAHGACAGLDSDQVLQYAQYAGLNPVAGFLYTLGRNFEILVAIGCITALGGWTRELSVKALAWLAAWPLLALGVALVAVQGVGAVARQGIRLRYDTGGGWHMAAGLVVTFVGIGLVALGQAGLWREWAKRRGAV